MWPDPYRRGGFMSELFNFIVGMLALVVFAQVLFIVLMRLMPWIILGTVIGLAIRWLVGRNRYF